MAKVTYDVTGVDDIEEGQHAPVGIYRAKVRSVDGPKASSKGNQMLEVVFDLTHDAAGKKLKDNYMPLWYYPILDHDHPFVQGRLKEFLLAFGLKPKGALDTDKQLVGKSVQLKLKSDTDQDGDYRPKVAKVMALSGNEPEEEPEPEPEPEDDEPDEPEDDGVDLDEMDRKELKAFIKEEELDVKVTKPMSDDDIREAIAAALPEDDEPEEEDDEPEEDDEEDDEPEDDGYDEMSVSDLKAELKERELPANGAKKVLVARLRKDDQEEPF